MSTGSEATKTFLIHKMAHCTSVVLNTYVPKTVIPRADIFSVKECDEEFELESGEVLLKTLYLSVDPYMRYKMMEDTETFYLEPWKVGQACDGPGIGIVLQSKFDDLVVNGLVETFSWPWKTICKIDGKLLKKVRALTSRERYRC